MKENNNIANSWFPQVVSLSAAASGSVVLASLDATSSRFGLAGTAALLACATVCLLLVIRRLAPGGSITEARKRPILLFILMVHVLALFLFFPPDEIVNDRPVATLDHAIHYYQIVRSRDAVYHHAQLNSYDPFFMAGYPAGVLFDIDMKGAELFCIATPFLKAVWALKLYILLCYATMALTLYKGCRLLGFAFEESVFGVLLCLCFFHAGRPYAGAFRFAGMFSFIFVSHLSLLVIGLFRSFLRNGSITWFFIAGPLVFMVHPTALIMMPVAFILLFAFERKSVRSKTVPMFFLWCLLVVAVNIIWLIPLLRYLDLKTPTQVFFQLSGMREALGKIVRWGSVPALALALFGTIGFARLVMGKRISIALPVGTAAVVLLLIAAYGCRIRCIDQLEPGRFLLSFLFFLAPLAGAGLCGTLGMLRRRAARCYPNLRIAAVTGLLLVPLWAGFVESKLFYRHQISTTLPDQVTELVRIVKDGSAIAGRFMVEDGPAVLYKHIHLPSMLPLLSGREQIGGPYPYTFLPHHYATFQLDKTFGKPLADYSPAELYARLSDYNIRWILTASGGARDRIAAVPSVTLKASAGRYSLWSVAGDFGPVFDGDARVTAAQNRISVSFERDPAEVVLKYHWDKGLRASAPAEIHPVWRGDDPVPFIELDPHQAREVVITYD